MTFTTRNDLKSYVSNLLQNFDFSEGPSYAESIDIVTDHLMTQDDWYWEQDMQKIVDRELPDTDAIYALLENTQNG